MALTRLAENLWISEAPAKFLGLHLTATMTVVRLETGGLLLHSPVALTDERRAAIDALGPVRHLYAPNTFHHLRLGDWSRAYPDAKVHAPRGLVRKRPDLRIDRLTGSAPDPALAGSLDELLIRGFVLEECVLFHGPSRTLIVADLVHNIGHPTHWWTRMYSRSMGFHGRIALSRFIALTAFRDRPAARASIDVVLALPFERLVVGHGAPVLADAHQALRRAYEFLPPGRQ